MKHYAGTYTGYKLDFISAHSCDYEIETSPMDQYGQYRKIYQFADGSYMYEVNRPVIEQVEVMVNGLNVKVDVKMLETEMWNTDDAHSVKYYEAW